MNRLTFLKTLVTGIIAAPAAAKAIQAAPVAVKAKLAPMPTAHLDQFGLTLDKILKAKEVLLRNEIHPGENLWMVVNPKQLAEIKADMADCPMTASEGEWIYATVVTTTTLGAPEILHQNDCAFSPGKTQIAGCNITTCRDDLFMHRAMFGTSIEIFPPESEITAIKQDWYSGTKTPYPSRNLNYAEIY